MTSPGNSLLALRPAKHPSTVVSAGWLPTADPMLWLEELGSCSAQGKPLTAYVVAASPTDPRPRGLFLVPRKGLPSFGPRVQPLTELLPGVHAHLDAQLSAGVLPQEQSRFFPYSVHFIHPTSGVVGFDPGDALDPARLLKLPSRETAAWNMAVPAPAFAPKIISLEPADPPSPEDLFAEAASGIGSAAGDMPDESLLDKTSSLGKGLIAGGLLGAGAIIGALGKGLSLAGAGKGKGLPPSLQQIEDWARKNWKQISDKRAAEIERLLRLMETNPEQGLLYALPLTGQGGRGVAPPQTSLGQRGNNFSLSGRGGASDKWSLENDMRLKLEHQYREAALREIQLGHHERAAYIYGNLLGDWQAAAKALIEARRFQEAISIYLYKLNNRAAAAQALEQAGLLAQAAAMHAQAKQFEKAGDLYARLGNPEQAREMWRSEVAEQKNPVEKARILSRKLDDDTEALDVLNLAWLTGSNAEATIAAIWAICRKHDDPGAAVVILRRIFEKETQPKGLHRKLDVADALVVGWSVEAIILEFQLLAYQHLSAELIAGSSHTEALLKFLPRLAADDRLLASDARRYLARRVAVPVRHSGPPVGRLVPESIDEIDKQCHWDSLSSFPRGISIAGYGRGMLAVAQLRADGLRPSSLRTPDDPGESVVVHHCVVGSKNLCRVFHFVEHRRIHYRAVDRARHPADDAMGTLREVLAVGPADPGRFALLLRAETSSLLLNEYSDEAQLLRSVPLDFIPSDLTGQRWFLSGRRGCYCIATGSFAAWFAPGIGLLPIEFRDSVTGVEISPQKQEFLVTTSREVLLVSVLTTGKRTETINLHDGAGDLPPPAACFLPDNSIVIAAGSGGKICLPESRNSSAATFHGWEADDHVLKIAPRMSGGFVLLTRKGKLLTFAN